MPILREVLRPRLPPLDKHHGREHRREENIRDHDIHNHRGRAYDQIEPYGGVRNAHDHDDPAKIPMDDTEKGAVPFALEDHVMPPADQELDDRCDEDDDPDALVSAGLFFVVVVVVADGEADDAADDGDYGCYELGHPVPADAVEEAQEEGAEGHEDEEAKDDEGGVDDEDARRGCAAGCLGPGGGCVCGGCDDIAGLRRGMHHIDRELSCAHVSKCRGCLFTGLYRRYHVGSKWLKSNRFSDSGTVQPHRSSVGSLTKNPVSHHSRFCSFDNAH